MSASIRSRIVALLLALAVPLVGIVAFALEREYRTSVQRAEDAAVELAVATANGVRQVLDDGHSVVEALSRNPAIIALDAPRCAPWLRDVDGMLPQFANIVVADTAGRVVCSASPMNDVPPNVTDREWFHDVHIAASAATGRYQIGNVTGRAVVVVAHPLRNAAGTLIGVVAAGIDLEHFQQLLADLPRPPDAVVTLADDRWTVLARSKDAVRWVGQTLPGDTVPERHVGPGLGIIRATGLDGIDRVFGYATLAGQNWRVYAGVPDTWLYAPVREAAIRRGVAIAALLAAVAALTVLLFRRVARSLSTLVDGTLAAVQEGGRVPETGPAEVVAVAHQFNVTLAARERAEAESRQARERYASVLHNAPYGVFVATEDGALIDVNPALVRMLGYPSDEALRRAGARAAFEDAAYFDALVGRALAGERLEGEEVRWRRSDGGRVLARLSCGAARLPDGDRVIEVIAEDVTERRALEEHLLETRKMEAIGRLAGGVAHDFNNLLTIVRGQAQFLLMELGDDALASEHATEIVEATQRGARLTRQLLAFGRRQPVEPIPLDVNDIVRNLQTMLRRVVGEDVSLEMRLDETLPQVSADPGQIEQILMNLLFNARDAMPAGGAVVIETAYTTLMEDDCRGRRGARTGDFIVLTVSDTGEGIAPDVMDRVFEPFFTTKPQGRGTGLGLATVYGIVSQNGGWIEVDSSPGSGTRFTVYLPRVLTLPPPEEDSLDEAEAQQSITVLVAEDEAAVRRVVAGTLRQRGYAVLEAGSGHEALQIAGAHRAEIDLLVTDEMMPGMRGTELARELVLRRPGVRLLFVSGYSDRVPAGDSYAGAPSAFLGKPFSQEQLLHAVARLLRRELAGA